MTTRPAATAERGTPLGEIRTALLILLVVALVGTGAELLLLDHDEDVRQWVPLALIALALASLAWHALRPSASSVRTIQAVMAGFVISGLVGVVYHYQGNMEFQLEVNPSARGLELFWKIMKAKAPPALAPAVMSQLGVLGLMYTYRHPALNESPDGTTTNNGA